jgi:hypothetical protein
MIKRANKAAHGSENIVHAEMAEYLYILQTLTKSCRRNVSFREALQLCHEI